MEIWKTLVHFSAILPVSSDSEGEISGIARDFSVPKLRN
jgi:hypothetical protein